ncbi:esterase/lipase family protein [Schlesneria paludicola]|uniref:esterase/lipase family protein n=1 Tax=Schlesneria paludicola TaxID=360056 RepID=UPI00058B975A|nr:alpha/beta hydrolase [Schlesneria paludicola]
MQVVFVHGMGRTPLSAWPLLWRLRQRHVSVTTFFYSVTFQSFASIEARLRGHLIQVASQGEYALIGHSLGGVLIRSAIASLPPETRLPARVFLLGSPVQPSRIAKYLSRNVLFRLATHDCGQLLASDDRMGQVAPSCVPTTSIIGTRGLHGSISPFGDEPNDGVVSESEVAADWITEELRVPVVHSFLPSNRLVTELILERIEPVASTL